MGMGIGRCELWAAVDAMGMARRDDLMTCTDAL